MATDRDGLPARGEALLATGTTAFQPTFVTAPEPAMIAALRELPADDIGPRVLGAHLEGPFLSPRRPGRTRPALAAGPRPCAAARGCSTPAPVSPGHAGARAAGRVRAHRRARRARRDGLRPATPTPPPPRPTSPSTAACARSRTSSTRCARARRATRASRCRRARAARRDRPGDRRPAPRRARHGAWWRGTRRPRGASRWSPTPRRRRGWATASSCWAGARCTPPRRRRARARRPAGGLGADDDRGASAT